jgi:MYXO-CTERM domain-containing protein
MKKIVLAAASVVALMSVVPAHADRILVAPEPGSSAQLVVGLFALGGLALIARKRIAKNQAE